MLIATGSGLAEVDPLSHVADEGIDLDADLRAHSESRERERLPKGGTSTQ